MRLFEALDNKANIQFSIDEITILNNSLNEVCHGVEIHDFDTNIGASREEAKLLLNSVNELMNELRSHQQSNKALQTPIDQPNSSLTIREKCYLEANGYQVTFYIRSLDSSKDHIGLVTVIVVNTEFGESSLKSAAQKILIQELQNLTGYFEQHIASLRKNPTNDSSTFLSCQNAFQVQALSGNILPENEGNFALRFMINTGYQKEKGNTSTFVGAEAEVTFENIQNFTKSIQTVLAKLSYSTCQQ